LLLALTLLRFRTGRAVRSDAARKIAEDAAKTLNLPLDFRVGLNFVTEP
jgi:hypothetical protein